jgi:hypothetical protein
MRGRTRWNLQGAGHFVYRTIATHLAHIAGFTEPMTRNGDFISKLVALVPKPRVNLTRFHNVFAPNRQYRAKASPEPAMQLLI